MNIFRYIFQDFSVNRGNFKILIILSFFRFSQVVANGHKLIYLLFCPYLVFYRIMVEWILGTELHWKTKIGPKLKIYHGNCLVINPGAVIGRNCTLRHCVTIGIKHGNPLAPCLGNNVDVGPHSIIIGNITIGDNVIIGAGSVVVRDVPSNSTVAGNPARVILKDD